MLPLFEPAVSFAVVSCGVSPLCPLPSARCRVDCPQWTAMSQRPASLPTTLPPKCHPTWGTAPPPRPMWPEPRGSRPVAVLSLPTAVTSPPHWPSRAWRLRRDAMHPYTASAPPWTDGWEGGGEGVEETSRTASRLPADWPLTPDKCPSCDLAACSFFHPSMKDKATLRLPLTLKDPYLCSSPPGLPPPFSPLPTTSPTPPTLSDTHGGITSVNFEWRKWQQWRYRWLTPQDRPTSLASFWGITDGLKKGWGGFRGVKYESETLLAKKKKHQKKRGHFLFFSLVCQGALFTCFSFVCVSTLLLCWLPPIHSQEASLLLSLFFFFYFFLNNIVASADAQGRSLFIRLRYVEWSAISLRHGSAGVC